MHHAAYRGRCGRHLPLPPQHRLAVPLFQRNVAPRSRIAQTLGLRRPARGSCTPGLHRPLEPSLGLMRADIGVAPLSVFGDPYELDPFDR